MGLETLLPARMLSRSVGVADTEVDPFAAARAHRRAAHDVGCIEAQLPGRRDRHSQPGAEAGEQGRLGLAGERMVAPDPAAVAEDMGPGEQARRDLRAEVGRLDFDGVEGFESEGGRSIGAEVSAIVFFNFYKWLALCPL